MTQPRFLTNLGRAVSWHRRKLAVLAAVAAVLTAINAIAPPPPQTVLVVRSAHSLGGGQVLERGDLESYPMPASAVPELAIDDPDLLIGQVLTAPMSAGQVLTEVNVLSSRASVEAGEVIAPLRIDDTELASLIRIGDRVDVLAAEPQGGTAHLIAKQLRVVTIPQPGKESGSFASSQSSGEALLLVATSREIAALLAQGAVTAKLSVVLH